MRPLAFRFAAIAVATSLAAGLPFTIATPRVLETLAGQHLPSAIRLRQMGSAKAVPGEGRAPLVLPGRVYLTYLIGSGSV